MQRMSLWCIAVLLLLVDNGAANISVASRNTEPDYQDTLKNQERWKIVPAQRVLNGQKQINAQSPVTNFHSPNENNLIEILNKLQQRWPVIVIVDIDPASLEQTRHIWNAIPERSMPERNFILITFNDSAAGVYPHLQGGIASLRRAISSLNGFSARAKGAGFAALLMASTKYLQAKGAVLLFTGRPAHDEEFALLTRRQFEKENGKLFVWWTDIQRFQNIGAETIYKELAENTGGAFHYFTEPAVTPSMQLITTDYNRVTGRDVILAVRQNVTGTTQIPVQIDSTVRELYFIARGNITTAVVRTPSGALIDLVQRSQGFDAAAPDGQLEVQLDTRYEYPGLWQFEIHGVGGSTVSTFDGASDLAYDVIVKGTSGLEVVVQNIEEDEEEWRKDGVILVIRGMDTTNFNISGLEIIDDKGQILSKLTYRQRNRGPRGEQVTEIMVEKDVLPKKQETYYMRINGIDSNGEAFTRITPSQPTSEEILIRLNAQSNLIVRANEPNQFIALDITNNGSRLSNLFFNGRSTQKILQGISPPSLRVRPQETKTIFLHFYADNSLRGKEDTVDVRVQGDLAISEISMLVYISNQYYTVTEETVKPTLSYKIQNDCKEVSQNCYSREWNMQATIQDKESGIREITSSPRGISFPMPLLIGTKAPVTISYRASCCDPVVIISVTDLQNNRKEYSINVYDESSRLSDGEIAAIVMGVIVLLIIIIVIIVLIVVCKRKHTHTFQAQQVAR